MKDLARMIIHGAEPDALRDVLAGPDCPEALVGHRHFQCHERRSLLERTVAAWQDLAGRMTDAASDERDAWWPAGPSARAAVLFAHAGLPPACEEDGCREGCMPVHARTSAVMARRDMIELSLPFEVREHAAALIRCQRRHRNLERLADPDEVMLRLAASMDLRVLYTLECAELAVSCSHRGAAALESFRERAERLGVFGMPAPSPVGLEDARSAGIASPDAHRAVNACRYFRLVADMREPGWFAERLADEARMPRGRLHLLVGPAGTGKSTWAEEHLSQTEVVSTDAMRRELTGDPGDQSQNYLVFQRCADRVRDLLGEGYEVTFDATNVSEKLRMLPVQAGRWAAAEIVSYFFDVQEPEALLRNRERERSVPEDVVRRQFRNLSAPALYEADRHCVVTPDGSSRCYWPRGAVD